MFDNNSQTLVQAGRFKAKLDFIELILAKMSGEGHHEAPLLPKDLSTHN